MNDTVAAIVGAFFIIGIAAGIIAVVAMSVLRAERRGNRGDYADPVDDDPYEPGEPPQGSGWDDTRPDGRSRWPGESDTDFRGR
jgi:NADH:ubiquinone oxidoreductase subunit 3 (subunit A)